MNKQIYDRVGKLLNSANPENDFSFLCALQKEQAPWLSDSLIQDCVIYSLVKYYGDYTLSYMWYEESVNKTEGQYQFAA